jgi:hypothetical protein
MPGVWKNCREDHAKDQFKSKFIGTQRHRRGFRFIDRRLPYDSLASSLCCFSECFAAVLVFPIRDALLFGMRMRITCINCFTLCLRDRESSATSRVLGPDVCTDENGFKKFVGWSSIPQIQTFFFRFDLEITVLLVVLDHQCTPLDPIQKHIYGPFSADFTEHSVYCVFESVSAW